MVGHGRKILVGVEIGTGDLDVALRGAPVKVGATSRMEGSGDSTSVVYDVDLDVDHEEDRAVGCLVLVHIRLLQSPGPTESAH